jgi:hypothetical protein
MGILILDADERFKHHRARKYWIKNRRHLDVGYRNITGSDKKGPDAELSNFRCDVVKYATSHNKN